jgi:STE24 endopeptidase
MKRLMLTVLAALTLLFVSSAYAAPAVDTSKSSASMASAAPATPAAQAFDADKATQQWLDTMSPEARAKSDAYFEGGYWLILWDFIVGLVMAWIFLGTGLSRRMRELAESMVKPRWLQTVIYAAEYILLSSVIDLPWVIYEAWFREHQYGMSNQTLGGFMGDQLIGLGIAMVFGIIAIPVVYAVIRKFTRTWWIWGAVVSMVFILFTVLISPVNLEPAFNKFYP